MNVQFKKAPQRRESDGLNKIIERVIAVIVLIACGTFLSSGFAAMWLHILSNFDKYGG